MEHVTVRPGIRIDLLAVFLAILSMMFGCYLWFSSAAATDPTAALLTIESEIARLERELADVLASKQSDSRVDPAIAQVSPARTTPDSDVTQLENRVMELAMRLDLLIGEVGKDGGVPASVHVDQAEAQREVLDRTLGDESRVKALGILRTSGGSGRTPEVVFCALDILARSGNWQVRSGVWRGLRKMGSDVHGEVRTAIVSALCRSMREDPSGKVREEAAENLADYIDDEGVRQCLQMALNDEDDSVRREAELALRGPKSRR